MKKKFRFKKGKKILIFKLVIYTILIYVMYQLTFNFLLDYKLEKSNKDFIIALLHDSNHHLLYENRKNNILDKFISFVSGIEIDNPSSILASTFNYKQNPSSDEEVSPVLSDYVDDPNPIEIEEPKVYIYNTHQLEGYDATNYADYNITPNVQMAAYLLKDRLNNSNIPTMVETGNITEFLSVNSWDYSYSYRASRYYLEEALKKYKNLDLIIDLHRDSIPHSSSTIEYDGKKYAKILFVVGKDYDSYENNLALTNKINELLKEFVPGISRGVIMKGGTGVNGIYNQDLNNNMILIECGGMENTLDEVINTVDILSKAIIKYMGDKNGG